MFRLYDFVCENCIDEKTGDPYYFEDLVEVGAGEEARAKCPKCGNWCKRTVNRKGPPRHLSWAMWRAELSD